MTTTSGTLGARRPRLTARALLLLAIVTILALYATVPIRGYLAQRSRAARLEREVAQLEAANGELLGDIARLRDPVYLERLARECLGMVGRGEIALILDPGSDRRPPPAC